MIEKNHFTFNELPVEIINLIFESVKIKDLRELRFICSYWSKIIRNIIDLRLNIEKLHILNKKKINAINANEIPCSVNEHMSDYYSIFTNVELYYTHNSYFLNNLVEDEEIVKFMCKKLKDDINMDDEDNCNSPFARKISYLELLNDVEKCCNYQEEMIWKIMANITDSNVLLENESHKNNYELYELHTDYPYYIESTSDYENHKELYESFDYIVTVAIIMIYPDKKTFSLHYQIRGGHL